MSKKSTKDIRFIMALYDEVKILEDDSRAVSRYQVGEIVGIQPKGVDTICKVLIQANFIRKEGEEDIKLTDNGIKLVESIRR